jgi:hypothetical protein
VHSRLGAGLFRSAAQELRQLFDDHPELIGVQYDPTLLPPGSRLRWIRAELDKMLENTDRSDPGLLLAYLGYQLGQREFLVYGLDIAETRAPRDPLLAVLRQVWLGQERTDAAAQPQAAPDAAPGGHPGDAK